MTRATTMLTKTDIARFQEDGYLVCERFFDATRDFAALRAEYERRLDEVANLLENAGVIANACRELDFDARVQALYAQVGGKLHNYLDICLPQRNVTEETPVHTGPATFELITDDRLLDLVQPLVGPDILSNPTQHVRIKPPRVTIESEATTTAEVATTVWHQDLATIMPEADHSDIVTVWIGITETSRSNGCLLVAPGSHKGGIAPHLHDPSANYSRQAIPDARVGKKRVALELPAGAVVLLHKLTMHASLPNRSERIRWSVDLRYQPVGQPTGRPWFPSFVARSESDPGSVLRDPVRWTELWREARAALAAKAPESFQRWPE